MWHYKRVPTGYYRMRPIGHKDSFMFDVLGNSENRSRWQKVCGYTICCILGHKNGTVCVEKGHIKERGAFELILCDRCKAKVLQYDGGKDE